MGREIKFRAWSMDMTGEFNVYEWETIKSTFASFIDDDATILMQYTGLKDKNGVEIYEGDILKSDKGVLFKVLWGKDRGRYYAITNNVYSKSNKKYFAKGMLWIKEHCEVIGNKYENPELLIT
jgi:uncharacterized phage protein (TIGR01671 family)